MPEEGGVPLPRTETGAARCGPAIARLGHIEAVLEVEQRELDASRQRLDLLEQARQRC